MMLFSSRKVVVSTATEGLRHITAAVTTLPKNSYNNTGNNNNINNYYNQLWKKESFRRRHICNERNKYFSTLSNKSKNAVVVPAKNDSNSVEEAVVVSSDGVVATHAIDFNTASRIEGSDSQIVTVRLEPGQVLRAESGGMMYMTDGVEMNTSTGGGVGAGFKRFLTGQNVFISDYTYKGDRFGIVALGTDFPSKIMRLSLPEWDGKIVCQKGALLCASHTVDIETEFTKKFSTGFFGGEGFVLQALLGEGDVFVKAGGSIIKKELNPGEQLRISSGSLVAFSQTVEYDIQMMPGFKNVLFGGEGLFVTTLTGPGTIWLQGMPPQRMISEIARRVPSGGGLGLAIPIPGMGSGGSGEEGGGNDDGNDTDQPS
eukprot:CAMPEP_0197829708 /NCGR_PEP_ID=MMETSP1437-20131217/6254_1 /TAXON_ID=49252 ORGANISM="Eucampia antarctica, Strain CCMP1452" /NCGR_SAMPLE_ID=MMETSP1437 /ASSEMBLY_ACC=CAM_ASM_001096 /LENGTH=371 /DNA_ID=CAMNT_0043431623 /DNA_START=25 /DNA_END=1140 /DNA_ORIENTATION=-